jgi:hypothetical protein
MIGRHYHQCYHDNYCYELFGCPETATVSGIKFAAHSFANSDSDITEWGFTDVQQSPEKLRAIGYKKG